MAEGNGDAAAALDAAIAQMREQGYAEKSRDREEPVHLIGVACGREARNPPRDQGRARLRLPPHWQDRFYLTGLFAERREKSVGDTVCQTAVAEARR